MTMQHLTIRQAGQTDLTALLAMYQHLNPGAVGAIPADAMTVFERFLAYQSSAIILGEVLEELVASAPLVAVPNLTRGGTPYGLIEIVVTHLAFRRQGFGRQVVQAATEAGWQQGCYKVMLLTCSTAPATLDFYRSVGIEQSKTGFQMRRHEVRTDRPGWPGGEFADLAMAPFPLLSGSATNLL